MPGRNPLPPRLGINVPLYCGTIQFMDSPLAFMTSAHHAVRNFVVRELPRNAGRPLSIAQIARALAMKPALVTVMVEELEKHLFFLIRNARGDVSWAFPVTSDPTPHRLRFSTGERIFGA